MPGWSRSPSAGIVCLGLSVVGISAIHFATNTSLLWIHEVLKRLYYVPIVVAALYYGSRGAAATALLASGLYLPHTLISWDSWTTFAVSSYGELVTFNVVGIVTGVLAERLRAERNRLQTSNVALSAAYRQLESSTAERIRAERLATAGQVAASVAHQVRTPLSAVHGCCEILGADYPVGHPKREFLDILTHEIACADAVIRTFLDVADPAPPRCGPADANDVARGAARLVEGGPAGSRRPPIVLKLSPRPLPVWIDLEQTERVIAELLVVARTFEDVAVVTVCTRPDAGKEALTIAVTRGRSPRPVGPRIAPSAQSATLALALAKHVIDKQGGSIESTVADDRFEVVVKLPRPSDVRADSGARSRRVAHPVVSAL